MRKFSDILLGCFVACLIAACTDLNLAGGGLDTETSGGTVVGLLTAEDGTPEIYAQVFCVPSSHNALKDPQLSDSLITSTDETGSYRFDRVKKGMYNIQVSSQDMKTGALLCGIGVGRDSVTVQDGALHPSAALKIVTPDAATYDSGYCYLPGTTFFAQVRSGVAVLSDLPAGYIPAANYFDTRDSAKNHVIKTGFSLAPAETVVITDLVPWKFSKKLLLNTTASGAGIAGTVTNFPVLIRLREGNFNFAQAKGDGGDLRFVKPNGAPLPFEIERWDPVARQAEVWVKVDTVYGNDSTRSIMMFWGDPVATPESNGVAVFDTANGFQGVWHLNRKCDDATYGGNNGVNHGTTDTTGIIGYCKKFDGSDSIKIAGLLGSPANITLSAWAQLDTVPEGRYGGEVLTIGDAVLIRMDFSVLGLGTYGAIHPYGDTVYYNVTSGQFLKQTGWHLITFTVDQNNHSQTIYIDGSAVRSRDSVISIDYSRVGQNTFIGTHGNGSTEYNFSGRIDEVRVYRKSISADYVKLSFMNQKEQDALVKW